jgi:hypothetical protein
MGDYRKKSAAIPMATLWYCLDSVSSLARQIGGRPIRFG